MRALFVEYPNDPGAWLVDNEYLFGSSMLVAPLLKKLKKEMFIFQKEPGLIIKLKSVPIWVA